MWLGYLCDSAVRRKQSQIILAREKFQKLQEEHWQLNEANQSLFSQLEKAKQQMNELQLKVKEVEKENRSLREAAQNSHNEGRSSADNRWIEHVFLWTWLSFKLLQSCSRQTHCVAMQMAGTPGSRLQEGVLVVCRKETFVVLKSVSWACFMEAITVNLVPLVLPWLWSGAVPEAGHMSGAGMYNIMMWGVTILHYLALSK